MLDTQTQRQTSVDHPQAAKHAPTASDKRDLVVDSKRREEESDASARSAGGNEMSGLGSKHERGPGTAASIALGKAASISLLAQARTGRGRLEEAIALHRESVDISRAILSDTDPRIAEASKC